MAAPTEDVDACAVATLPPQLLGCILLLLPVDERLRAREVCRAWRAALSERSIWARLDISAAAGLARPATGALLRAAHSAAGGQLCSLDVSGAAGVDQEVLSAVIRASGASLTELRMCGGLDDAMRANCVRAMLAVAPQLRLFHADLFLSAPDCLLMLRGMAPFGPVRVRRLRVVLNAAEHDAIVALGSAAAAHPTLEELMLSFAPLDEPAMLCAVVDAALTARLRSLRFDDCNLTAASAPELARLLRNGAALHALEVAGGLERRLLLGQEPCEPLCAALRANRTLTALCLTNAHLWRTPVAMVALLQACTAHVSLQWLDLSHNHAPIEHRELAGEALAALLRANAPALHTLCVTECWLGPADPGMGPLLDALATNKHLRCLRCADNRMSEALARDRLLPALRANAGALRALTLASEFDTTPSMLEAEAVVRGGYAAAKQ